MKDETSIVRLFFAKMKPEFMELSESDRIEFMAKDRANLDDLGMKAISMIECSVTDSEWDYVGVEGWPSMEAIKKREQFENEELKISKYVDHKTLLGVEQPFENYGK